MHRDSRPGKATMQRDKKLKPLGRMLATLLGRNPDSQGLLPDAEGWIRMKTLLQALAEMPEYRGVREADLVDICCNRDTSPLEMEKDQIRARERFLSSVQASGSRLPKILHICIRSRAWPHVHEKGLKSSPEQPLLLTQDADLALRMGKRKDPKPVLLKIHTEKAHEAGIVFLCHGEQLFSVSELPPSLVMGPPLPKEEKKPKARPKTPAPLEKQAFTPGSFLLRSEEEKAASRYAKNKKDSWKHNKKRLRRQGQDFEP